MDPVHAHSLYYQTFGVREEVLDLIERGVTDAEEAFLNRYTRHFDPTSEQDYLLMAPLCTWSQLFPLATGCSNVGVVFLRHYILDRRPDLLPIEQHREDLVNGLIGWLNSNPPPREYQKRISVLDNVTEEVWGRLEMDHLKALVHLADTIYRTQSLPTLSSDPHRSAESPGAAHFSAFFREGAGYLLDLSIRDAVETLSIPREVGLRTRDTWVKCCKIYAEPGAASYT